MRHIVVIDNETLSGYLFRKEILAGFLSEGYKVTFVGEPHGYVQELETMGCRVIPVQTRRRGVNPFQDAYLFCRYLAILVRLKPEAVLTYTIKPNVYGGLACRLLRIRYYPNITGLGSPLFYPGLLQRLTSFLYKLGIGNATTVFFQNTSNEQFFRRRKLLSNRSSVVLLPGSGVNLQQHRFEAYPEEQRKLRLLVISRLMRDKGIDEILSAARKIKGEYPEVIFRLIGNYDGNYEEKIDAAVHDGIIEFMGRVSDVHSYIKNSHAVVHASYHEGMSNVLLEGAACGRPVIATDIPGCRETFVDGISGIACQPHNVDSLVSAIRAFIELPHAQKREMGRQGRKRMECQFDRRIVVEKYIKEIERHT